MFTVGLYEGGTADRGHRSWQVGNCTYIYIYIYIGLLLSTVLTDLLL